MLDPADTMRNRSLGAIRSLPRYLIRKDIYRLLILKCRDKAEKVRKQSFLIIIELGVDHAPSILTLPELTMTTKHLLQIANLIPSSEVAGGLHFTKQLSKYISTRHVYIYDIVVHHISSYAFLSVACCVRLYSEKGPPESIQASALTAGGISRNGVTAKAILATILSLDLHNLQIDQMLTIIEDLMEQ